VLQRRADEDAAPRLPDQIRAERLLPERDVARVPVRARRVLRDADLSLGPRQRALLGGACGLLAFTTNYPRQTRGLGLPALVGVTTRTATSAGA
jgi:hypothetical protein